MNELLVEAKVENLDSVLDFINKELESYSMKAQSQFAIAVEEIFVNICHYAYEHQTGDAAIRISSDQDEGVTIELEDSGKPYNPLENEDPDITLDAQDREIGGLGIFMVKNMMDSVEYRHENNKNILTLKKSES